MDSTILAAIISGALGLLGSVSGYLLKQYFDNRVFLPVRFDRRSSINGEWTGTTYQDINKLGAVESSVTAKLSAKNRQIRGELTVDPGIPDIPLRDVYELTGGFLYNRFLRIEYQTTTSNAVEFGSFVVELSADGRRLEGMFVGYGAFSEQIVFGRVVLNKTTRAIQRRS